jgi:hypothetical protein
MEKSHPAPKTSRQRKLREVPDAVELLKADHREVARLFHEFESAESTERKAELATRICTALKILAEIEEEIFYPAFLAATHDKDIHHEAEIEHAEAKHLIAKIEKSSPADDYFNATVHVLSEMIRHHVNEEEKRGGMFTLARKSKLNLKRLGGQLQARKAELTQLGEQQLFLSANQMVFI